MKDWNKLFSTKKNVIRLNDVFSSSLAHCPLLMSRGWRFRCVECHIETGTYPTGYRSRLHSHNEYQIEIPISGRFRFASGGADIRLGPCDTAVIPWKLPHRWTCEVSGVMIGISLQLLPTLESMLRQSELMGRIVSIPGRLVRNEVRDLLLAERPDEDAGLHATTTACHLFLLLAKIMERILPEPGAGAAEARHDVAETRERETIAWIIRKVDEGGKAPSRLDSWAREVGTSERQLHRLFFKHVGKSFHDYMLERRLDQARRQIADKGQKMLVKEIAFDCGFSSLAYFSSAFRKAYGVSPSQMLLPDVKLKSGTTFPFYDAADAGEPAGHSR